MVGSASIIPNSVIKIKRQSEAVTGWNQKERKLPAFCVIRIAMTASMCDGGEQLSGLQRKQGLFFDQPAWPRDRTRCRNTSLFYFVRGH
jgi:hypothetical protein